MIFPPMLKEQTYQFQDKKSIDQTQFIEIEDNWQ